MQYNREQLIEILENHYGKSNKEENSNSITRFGTKSLTEIGNEIGFTKDQMSKRVNSISGMKSDTYQATIAHVNNVITISKLEIRNNELEQQLKEEQQLLTEEKDKREKHALREKIFQVLAGCFAIVLIGIGMKWFYTTYTTNTPIEPIIKREFVKVKDLEAGCLLSKSQRDETIESYMLSIQRALAIEGLIFSLNLRDSIHTEEKGLEIFVNRTHRILINAQKEMRDAGFIVDNGQNLADLLTRFSSSPKDKIYGHFRNIMPTLTNENSSYREIAEEVIAETRKVQELGKIELDNVLKEENILDSFLK